MNHVCKTASFPHRPSGSGGWIQASWFYLGWPRLAASEQIVIFPAISALTIELMVTRPFFFWWCRLLKTVVYQIPAKKRKSPQSLTSGLAAVCFTASCRWQMLFVRWQWCWRGVIATRALEVLYCGKSGCGSNLVSFHSLNHSSIFSHLCLSFFFFFNRLADQIVQDISMCDRLFLFLLSTSHEVLLTWWQAH